MKQRYKIYVANDSNKDEFNVEENGEVTAIWWRTLNGGLLRLNYETSEVISNLKSGKWIKVKSKTERFKSQNLFSLEDL